MSMSNTTKRVKEIHQNTRGQGLVTMTQLGTIVLPLKGDTAIIAGNQPAVADDDPMGVARRGFLLFVCSRIPSPGICPATHFRRPFRTINY